MTTIAMFLRSGALPISACAVCLALGCSAPDTSPAGDDQDQFVDVTQMLHELAAPEEETAEKAVAELVALGDAVVPALGRRFDEEPDAGARRRIVAALAQLHSDVSVNTLRRAASDEAVAVRRDAITALGNLASEEGRGTVERALHDEEPSIVEAATIACRRLCESGKALRRLVELAIDPEDVPLAATARNTLQRIRSARVRRPEIRKSVREIALPEMEDPTSPKRQLAALVAMDARFFDAISALGRCAADPHNGFTRTHCIIALGDSGARKAVAVLAGLKGGSDAATTAAACRSLRKLARGGFETEEALRGCPPERTKKRRRPPVQVAVPTPPSTIPAHPGTDHHEG